MRTPNVTKLILTFLILFGCTNQDETELIEPEPNVLYQHYPEFKTDENLQDDQQTLGLLQFLAENPEILGITELSQLQVATETFYSNPNGRTNSNGLWDLICSDSTVVVHDIIVPIYSNSNSANGRTSNGSDCDCISTATGLKLPKHFCCYDSENSPSSSSGGGSTSSGSNYGSSTIGISYGSPSSVESFFNPPRYGGGVSTGNNTGSGTGNILLLPTNTPLELILELSENESNWLSGNPTLENDIKAFLTESLSSPESIKLAKMVVNAAINGGEIDLSERLVYDPHLDQDYKNQMAEQEKEIFNGLSTTQKIAYLMSAQQAWNYAEAYYEDSFWNGNRGCSSPFILECTQYR